MISPFLDFGVAVAKRDPACAVVKGGGAIDPSVVAGKIEKV
jgi:hypothetical protein